MEKFAEIVKEKSGGKIEVKLFPGGVLGGDVQTVSALAGRRDRDDGAERRHSRRQRQTVRRGRPALPVQQRRRGRQGHGRRLSAPA